MIYKFFSCDLLTFRYAEKLILKEGILFICFRVTIEERYLSLVNVFTFTKTLLSRYGLKGPVYLKDRTGQVVTPHVEEDSVVFGPGMQ